ncbi:penicillin-binding transpeptidase domain-containing protein [Aeromicrobium chenweiae]|uniref:Beta-lactamase n=1 Tax=Aeromicrobium chenweiae TaxID=2079793 RepID=A0A2S0WQZ3_9ACTN|nr:penicillin-binding transpeptidase domain-containing protein [Aeromicrobium chenweiae]AWB93732.1 penicillin-binding protein [Aeromicrobium chenweiae]TGN30419.1 penicillin-binding protein [Aeromicrobium chenweiae]
MLPPRRARLVASTTGLVVALAVLTACSDNGPDAGDAADDLAAALTSGNVAKVATTGSGPDHQTELDRIVEGLGTSTQKVTVKDVAEKDGAATVTLSTRRSINGATWSYETKASLVEGNDRWEVDWKPSLVAPVTKGERLVARTVAAERGDILGAEDEPLVTARPVVRVGIDKTRVDAKKAGTSAVALAKLLDIDTGTFRKRVEAAGPQAFVEGLVLRKGAGLPSGQDLEAIPGAVGIDAELPLAPTRAFGQPLLGTVGEATAETIKESKGALKAGDQVGLSGLQKRYDTRLRGTPGIEVTAITDEEGAEARELFAREPQAGKAVRTTLDPKLQAAADDILGDVDPASAIVAIRPSTGELLAVASGPGSDGNDTATSGRYAPGSTFKIVTALTFLRSGVTPETKVRCSPTVTVDGRTFKNYSDYPSSALGNVSLTTAIANSCNTAMIATRKKAPQARLADAAYALGLGRDVDLGVPAFLGSVPTTAKGTERAASMIGQGRIEASPLVMAVVAASVQDRRLVTPVLLPDLEPKDAPTPANPLNAQEAISLADMMRAVVTDGSGRFLLDVPGSPVGAKTGTAEYGDDVPPRTHAWMIGTHGNLAVAVFVGDGASGSATAGPLLEEFLRAAR